MREVTCNGVTIKFKVEVEILESRAKEELRNRGFAVNNHNIKLLQNFMKNDYEVSEDIIFGIIDGDVELEMSAFDIAFDELEFEEEEEDED